MPVDLAQTIFPGFAGVQNRLVLSETGSNPDPAGRGGFSRYRNLRVCYGIFASNRFEFLVFKSSLVWIARPLVNVR